VTHKKVPLVYIVDREGVRQIQLKLNHAALRDLKDDVEALTLRAVQSPPLPGSLLAPEFNLVLHGNFITDNKARSRDKRLYEFVKANPGIQRGVLMQRFKMRRFDMEETKKRLKGILFSAHHRKAQRGQPAEYFWVGSEKPSWLEKDPGLASWTTITVDPPSLAVDFRITETAVRTMNEVFGRELTMWFQQGDGPNTLQIEVEGFGMLQVLLEDRDFEPYAAITARSFLEMFEEE